MGLVMLMFVDYVIKFSTSSVRCDDGNRISLKNDSVVCLLYCSPVCKPQTSKKLVVKNTFIKMQKMFALEVLLQLFN